MPFDFLARQAYYIDHLAPIWNALPENERGEFFVMGPKEYALKRLKSPKIQDYTEEGECGINPIITAAYGDAVRAADIWAKKGLKRHVTLLEHGVGLTFGKAAYADGLGQRGNFSLIPVQSLYVKEKVHPELKDIPHPVVGVPKLDKYYESFNQEHPMPKRPTIAFAFHHGDKLSRPAEVGSAWQHYADSFPLLPQKYRWIFHAHPSTQPPLLEVYKQWGLEVIADLDDVFEQADVLISDCGSSAYEFCTTGKPVILLNAPWFDKKASWGIRFWDYSNIGPQVEGPSLLEAAVDRVVNNPNEFRESRRRMVHDLFPHFGRSTQRVLEELHKVVPSKETPPTFASVKLTFPVRTTKDQGVLYMCFGRNAQSDLIRSMASLRNTGSTLPIAVVGDQKIEGTTFIPWEGESPFDYSKKPHFQFRAGRIKPFLSGYSPFNQTLYVDTDTTFLASPDKAFGFLNNWDFVIAQERLLLSQLYNRKGAGWEHDIAERDATIEAFGGGNGDFPFWNSGVFFWRNTRYARGLFKLWYEEWIKFQGWDEQKALMRAGNRSRARIFVLGEIWNFPHKDQMTEKVHESARLILHEYGRGSSRIDIQETK